MKAIYFDKIGLMTFTHNQWQDAYRHSAGDDGDDIPLLMQFEEGVTISPIIATVNYAIAFPMHSSLREDVNRGIARLEGGELVFRCLTGSQPPLPLLPSPSVSMLSSDPIVCC